MPQRRYTGRFAPSPTGPLHAGSLVAALASWLDARAHAGRWLVRIEDVDAPRCPPGAGEFILQQLGACGLWPDEAPLWQSQRGAAYAQALQNLVEAGCAYPCTCSRKTIEQALLARGWVAQKHGERVYPGTCRPVAQAQGAGQTPIHSPARSPAWRLRCDGPGGADVHIAWQDRRLGAQQQNLSQEVGDFVLKRADGLWAYQLAVVVDDAAQGVSHIVRGQDLADNTARQIQLQRALGVATPQYLHTPLVLAADGHKLSKQNGAQALDLRDPLAALRHAGAALGLAPAPLAAQTSPAEWLACAVGLWTKYLHAGPQP